MLKAIIGMEHVTVAIVQGVVRPTGITGNCC